MNANDYGSLPNKKTSTDSGPYGNGSVYSRPQQAQAYSYNANSYAPRENGKVNSYQNMQSTNRAVYDSAASSGTDRNYASRNNAYSGYQAPQYSASANEARPSVPVGAQSYRTNYSAAKQNSYASSATANGNGNGNGAKINMTGNGGVSGNGNGTKVNVTGNGGKSGGSGNGNGNGKKPPKKKSLKQRFLAWLKKFLRSIYLLGKPMRIFLASATGFVLICMIVIISVSNARKNNEEAISAELTLTTPVPTVAPTATPEPTPSPTPEIRIEKGAEGEDVMALQKRLMELGYLAIDEPTSYFGNATKAAVKLFQRQHELQQDGICGTETISMIYAKDAQPYVMKEGAEGDDIQSFQEQLVELGYLDSKQVTSYYGTDTVDAVKDFQRRNYLTKDGKAGQKTLDAINSPDARVSYAREQEIIAEKKKQAALARASSAAGRIDKFINAAKKQLGDPYILGKSGPDTFDCSGLAVYCLRQANVYTRRLNAAGLSKTSSWKKISDLDDVQRGDLLFFKSDDSSSIGHVGIYIGGGEMIDASSANGKVVRRSAKSSYWRRNFVVARRPIV
ncbi:MAG: peptidoglycan-binding protein [Christensenella sp.]|nr:peptidoglycan-binding protein [Christensenella sp.]